MAQRIVGGDHHQIDRFGLGECHHAIDIGCLDRHAFGILRDAAVARRTVDPLDGGVFPELLDHRVFPAARADDQYLHGFPSVVISA